MSSPTSSTGVRYWLLILEYSIDSSCCQWSKSIPTRSQCRNLRYNQHRPPNMLAPNIFQLPESLNWRNNWPTSKTESVPSCASKRRTRSSSGNTRRPWAISWRWSGITRTTTSKSERRCHFTTTSCCRTRRMHISRLGWRRTIGTPSSCGRSRCFEKPTNYDAKRRSSPSELFLGYRMKSGHTGMPWVWNQRSHNKSMAGRS